MHFFRPEIERLLRLLGIITFGTLVILPIAWGYEQRKQARTWQSAACTYRMRELALRSPLVARVDSGGDPCRTLERLGFVLEIPR